MAGFGWSVPAVPLQRAGGPQSFQLSSSNSGASLRTLGAKTKPGKANAQEAEPQHGSRSETLSPGGSSAPAGHAAPTGLTGHRGGTGTALRAKGGQGTMRSSLTEGRE